MGNSCHSKSVGRQRFPTDQEVSEYPDFDELVRQGSVFVKQQSQDVNLQTPPTEPLRVRTDTEHSIISDLDLMYSDPNTPHSLPPLIPRDHMRILYDKYQLQPWSTQAGDSDAKSRVSNSEYSDMDNLLNSPPKPPSLSWHSTCSSSPISRVGRVAKWSRYPDNQSSCTLCYTPIKIDGHVTDDTNFNIWDVQDSPPILTRLSFHQANYHSWRNQSSVRQIT